MNKYSLLFLLFCANTVFGQFNRQNFDDGWRFHFGHAQNPEKDFRYGLETVFSKSGGAAQTAIDPTFNDSLWRTINLPHDWGVELPFVFDPAFNVLSHGYKPLGGNYPATSIGWYRKHFTLLPAQAGRRHQLVFDGVFRDADFWINGFYLGNNKSGYTGVAYDITDFLRFDKKNVLVVRVDATQYEGWFYEGAGIYRHVWLNSYPDVHIAHDGIFAYADLQANKAAVTVETEVLNEGSAPADFSAEVVLIDRNGNVIAKSKPQTARVEFGKMTVAKQILSVDKPRIWNLDDPYLYNLRVDLKKKRSNHRSTDDQIWHPKN